MRFSRTFFGSAAAAAALATAGCSIGPAPPPPPIMRPAVFTPLGLGAVYLSGDVIGGRKARAAKMKAAKIAPLPLSEVPGYMATTETQLRQQTAGIGVDVLRLPDSIVIRIPASLTFATGSAVVKPQFDATLLEIARTVKARTRTYVDVLAHTDTSGTPQVNQSLSDKRAAAVASYLSRHGVSRARLASRGLGENAPLYNPETSETEKAANRRVEIRVVPYRG